MHTMRATRAPGILGLTRFSPKIRTKTTIEIASVAGMVSVGTRRIVARNRSIVPPGWDPIPKMPPTWPIATWMPTPVRKPMRTLRDRKLAMKPSRNRRATRSSPQHIRALSPAIAT